jgi:hypothetical protein
MKEIAVGDATSGILYNFLPKVIITLQGLDIHNMSLPKIWLAYKNITKFKGRNITQYIVFEGLDVVGKTTLLADAEISSLAKPANGVGLQVRCYR